MSDKTKLMATISQGGYIKGTRKNETYNMKTTARFMKESFAPCKIAQSVERTHYTTELVKNQEYLIASLFKNRQVNIAKTFGLKLERKIESFVLVMDLFLITC